MNKPELIKQIFLGELFEQKPKSYPNVYFIKGMLREDNIAFFSTFRYRVNKQDVVIVSIKINLDFTDKNVCVSLIHIKPMKKFTKTVFRKSFKVVYKGMDEIITSSSILLGETLDKLEERIKCQKV